MPKYEISFDLRQAVLHHCSFPQSHSQAIRNRLRNAHLAVPASLELEATMVVEPNPKDQNKPVFLLTWACNHPEREVRRIVDGYIAAHHLYHRPVKPRISFVKIPDTPGSPIAAEFVTLEEYYEQRNQAVISALSRFDRATIFQPS